MSAIHIAQIAKRIDSDYSGNIDRSDLKDKDRDIDGKILSRCLAAHAIFVRSGCSLLEAAESVTDGGDDHGLDAIFFSPQMQRLFLVQAKWIKSGKGEPESGDVAKFCAGVRDLINLEKDRFNEKIQRRWEDIDNAVTAFGVKYELIVIYTGINDLASHSSRLLNDLVDELNDADPVVSFNAMNQNKVYSSLVSSVAGDPIDLEIALSGWGMLDTPYRAYYGTISGSEIADWWEFNGDSLFSSNLRKMLGSTDVNAEIRETLDKRPDDFWYFNNGVTVVASKVVKSMVGGSSKEVGVFKVHGASVVNGAQTVSTIGKYENSTNNLERVRVPIRIISLENSAPSFGADVTRANNRQNRIEARDFVAQDPEQLRLRTEISMEGYEYNLTRAENFKSGPNAFDLVEATAALACANSDMRLAVQAKREIGRFWVDTSKAPYKTIFNAGIHGISVIRSVEVIRVVDACLNDVIRQLNKKSGRDYGIMVHGNRIIAALVFTSVGRSRLSDMAISFDVEQERDEIEAATLDAAIMLGEKAQAQFPGGFLATIFKNPAKSKALYDSCLVEMGEI